MWLLLSNLKTVCIDCLWSIYKFVLHCYTGKSELERICADHQHGRHTPEMTKRFVMSLKHSRKIENVGKIVSLMRPFSVTELLVQILETKKIRADKPITIVNMRLCLQSLRMVHILQEEFQKMRRVAFDYVNAEHVDLLETLWRQLKPDMTRSSARLSEEWGDLGFQGKDPATDFRGMGLLGLQQLVFFSHRYPSQAQELLKESQVNSRHFPFAATSINITAFVLDLLERHHLHEYIFSNMDEIILCDRQRSPDGPSDDSSCVALGKELIHEHYCKVFMEFGCIWTDDTPKDVMAFPKIFGAFKQQTREKYPSLQ